MIRSVRFTAVLDTNVLFPLYCRDILLWFAHYELYTPKWSVHIFDEWEDVMRRQCMPEEKIQRQLEVVNMGFPDARVRNYQPLIPSLNMKDLNDRHVLAAAIKANANVIVTNNLKDFNSAYLAKFNLIAQNPDDFLTDMIDLNPNTAVEAFKAMILQKKKPPMTAFEVLEVLKKSGLPSAANYLHSQI